MRHPASFTRFLLAACYSVCMVQVAAGVAMMFYAFGAMLLANRTATPPADPIMIGNGIVSCVAVAFTWIQYKRGELDEYDNRRQRTR